LAQIIQKTKITAVIASIEFFFNKKEKARAWRVTWLFLRQH